MMRLVALQAAFFLQLLAQTESLVPTADTEPVVDLLTRTLGSSPTSQFDLVISPTLCDGSVDPDNNGCFELSDAAPASGKAVLVAGSTVSALTTGIGVYLKRFCNASLTWANNGGLLTGIIDFNSSNPLPPVGQPASSPITAARAVKWTYYMNVVDYSYSFVWWDWQRWQLEVDWMALHGVNLALAYTGQEEVYRQLYLKHGLNSTDLGEFFGGPAYLSWSRGQGLAGLGGPLPEWWYQQQATLNKQILAAMRALGISPILPGFQGNVPLKLHSVYPHANISQSGWLDALDPLFPQLADEFMELLLSNFGANDHFYQADGLFSGSSGPWDSSDAPGVGIDGTLFEGEARTNRAEAEYQLETSKAPPCEFTDILPDSFLYGCSRDCAPYNTATEAMAACAAEPTCGGITSGYGGKAPYQLRSGNTANVSPHNETSYRITNVLECHPPEIDQDAYARATAAYTGLNRTDPDAIWVYQTWIWRGYDSSKLPYLRGWVSAAPPGKLLLLDQTAERIPLWSMFNDWAFLNTSFIWCAMHEMGGNVGLFGNLQTLSDGPATAFQLGSGALAGVGIDPEGINQNPAYYELALEAPWRGSKTVSVSDWLIGESGESAAGASWSAQRCGTRFGSASATEAWALLLKTVYANATDQKYEHHMKYCPTSLPTAVGHATWSLPVVRPSWYNTSILHQAWGLLIDAAEANECCDSATGALTASFAFDLVDVGREFLSVAPCLQAYDALNAAASAVDGKAAASANATMTEVLSDLDTLLLSEPSGGLLMGRWIHNARNLAASAAANGSTAADADLMEMNARAQVTSWAPQPDPNATQLDGLWDYGNKAWGGLVGPFYSRRYELFAKAIQDAADAGAKVDIKSYIQALNSLAHNFQFETHWSNSSTTEPANPVGDVVTLSRKLWQKYAPLA